MTDFFSKISGAFTSALLMAAFFPVLLFLTAFTLVVLPISPYGHGLVDVVKDPTKWDNDPFAALVFTIGVLMLAVILFYMNVPIVRLYEGYPWKDSWIGRQLLERQKRRFNDAARTRRRIKKLGRATKIAQVDTDLGMLSEVQGNLGRLLNTYYPDELESVLPTTLGNVIRSFETYPFRQYGAPAINLWPRLQGVIDTDFAQSLDDVKTSFDFMVHCAFLGAVLSVLTLAAGLYWNTRALSDLWQPWLVGSPGTELEFAL